MFGGGDKEEMVVVVGGGFDIIRREKKEGNTRMDILSWGGGCVSIATAAAVYVCVCWWAPTPFPPTRQRSTNVRPAKAWMVSMRPSSPIGPPPFYREGLAYWGGVGPLFRWSPIIDDTKLNKKRIFTIVKFDWKKKTKSIRFHGKKRIRERIKGSSHFSQSLCRNR